MAWKDISEATALAFLRGKQDQELIWEFENERGAARPAKTSTAKSVVIQVAADLPYLSPSQKLSGSGKAWTSSLTARATFNSEQKSPSDLSANCPWSSLLTSH
jgi:hypothetical protein